MADPNHVNPEDVEADVEDECEPEDEACIEDHIQDAQRQRPVSPYGPDGTKPIS